MMHLPLLKSLPLAGADLVLAEIMSTAIPVARDAARAAGDRGNRAAAGSALRRCISRRGYSSGILITLPVTLLAIDTALCTVVNGSAVLFPAWIRLGPGGAGGVEMMGQAMLAMIMSALAFALLLLVPVALGGGRVVRAQRGADRRGRRVACLIASAILGAELYVMMQLLGRAFERAEPQQIT